MQRCNVSFVYEDLTVITTIVTEKREEAWEYAEDVHIPDLFENKGELLEVCVDREEIYSDDVGEV
tara:strand:- start:555 stop:749 length:195 start_codon:yes stop_codon:yes gene_type:complete